MFWKDTYHKSKMEKVESNERRKSLINFGWSRGLLTAVPFASQKIKYI